jgi:hypothetical protein
MSEVRLIIAHIYRVLQPESFARLGILRVWTKRCLPVKRLSAILACSRPTYLLKDSTTSELSASVLPSSTCVHYVLLELSLIKQEPNLPTFPFWRLHLEHAPLLLVSLYSNRSSVVIFLLVFCCIVRPSNALKTNCPPHTAVIGSADMDVGEGICIAA